PDEIEPFELLAPGKVLRRDSFELGGELDAELRDHVVDERRRRLFPGLRWRQSAGGRGIEDDLVQGPGRKLPAQHIFRNCLDESYLDQAGADVGVRRLPVAVAERFDGLLLSLDGVLDAEPQVTNNP